jgi:hypothetical protein
LDDLTGEKMTERKELIRKYKQTPLPMGIFQIKNLANGKIFIGTSKNLPGKLNSCRFQLINGSHPNRELQKDYAMYGESGFSFEILDRLEPKDDPLYSYDDDLKTLEGLWLDRLGPYGEKGYNRKRPTKET